MCERGSFWRFVGLFLKRFRSHQYMRLQDDRQRAPIGNPGCCDKMLLF